jgi:hypothetical protein
MKIAVRRVSADQKHDRGGVRFVESNPDLPGARLVGAGPDRSCNKCRIVARPFSPQMTAQPGVTAVLQ